MASNSVHTEIPKENAFWGQNRIFSSNKTTIMEMFVKTTLAFILTFLLGFFPALGQGIQVSIGTTQTCSSSDTVSVPVTILNGTNMGAISLAINYDPTRLQFVGTGNIHPSLSNDLLVNAGTFNGIHQIRAGWFSLISSNIHGIAFNLKFIANQSSTLNFDTNTVGICEITDSIANPYSGISFISGGVNLLTPSFSNISRTLQFGGNINICNQSFNTSGTYTIVCPSGAVNGCDSTIFLNLSVASIPTTTSISSVQACVGDTISIPITINGGTNIGAISLALNYNASALSFIGFENANPAIQSSNLLVNAGVFAGQSQVRLSW
ncbi:MAG: cohesin domain-containing protein, partial [Bacteroidota bacterium]